VDDGPKVPGWKSASANPVRESRSGAAHDHLERWDQQQQAAYQANPGCGSHDGEYKHEQSKRLLLQLAHEPIEGEIA
jgi:hypothetical protein